MSCNWNKRNAEHNLDQQHVKIRSCFHHHTFRSRENIVGTEATNVDSSVANLSMA